MQVKGYVGEVVFQIMQKILFRCFGEYIFYVKASHSGASWVKTLKLKNEIIFVDDVGIRYCT